MRDSAFRISRKEFILNFPFFMEKGKFFWEIFLFTCGKGRDFFEFLFSHEKKSWKNEFLSTKMSKISDFCGKKRDCLFISLLNDHPVDFIFYFLIFFFSFAAIFVFVVLFVFVFVAIKSTKLKNSSLSKQKLFSLFLSILSIEQNQMRCCFINNVETTMFKQFF